MSATATAPPAGALAKRSRVDSAVPRDSRDGAEVKSLEDVVLRAWDALVAAGAAECPVCRSELSLDGCAGCGAVLS